LKEAVNFLLSHRAVLPFVYCHEPQVGSMWTAKAHELHKIAFMGPFGHAGWA